MAKKNTQLSPETQKAVKEGDEIRAKLTSKEEKQATPKKTESSTTSSTTKTPANATPVA